MRVSITIDSADTEPFRGFLAYMTVSQGVEIPVEVKCCGPEKWTGTSAPFSCAAPFDAANFLRGLADRLDPQPEKESQ